VNSVETHSGSQFPYLKKEILLLLLLLVVVLDFWGGGSLCSPGWPWTHSDPPFLASSATILGVHQPGSETESYWLSVPSIWWLWFGWMSFFLVFCLLCSTNFNFLKLEWFSKWSQSLGWEASCRAWLLLAGWPGTSTGSNCPGEMLPEPPELGYFSGRADSPTQSKAVRETRLTHVSVACCWVLSENPRDTSLQTRGNPAMCCESQCSHPRRETPKIEAMWLRQGGTTSEFQLWLTFFFPLPLKLLFSF
jgi:hypothetical protein